ncbi:tyrosine-type recombinase/integrase [Massilia sp. FT127W]|uniref:Tyrosine-type recombinase/integrase n=1 Tax=Pseudoduganella aquatica TaxID=2660641 RepID=A0A7X4KQP2_9BURK|nr:tyrosine-type recombinase/integrase [Pseudoduganella aquatica]
MRVERGEFVVDRSFEELERAKLFLEDTKTPQGRLLIAQGKDRASLMVSEVERLAVEFIKEGRCSLGHAIDSYIKAYVQPGLDSKVDKERQTAKAARARLMGCRRVLIPSYKLSFSAPSGPLATLGEFAKGRELKEIGDFYIDELTEQDTTEYISARLGKGRAKSTVKREVYALQSVVNKLRYTDNKAWKRLAGHNPFILADKSKLKGGEKRRRRVITEAEEEALLTELRRCRNPEMPLVFAVALSTGMRRAEVLGLLWSQVDLKRGVINLDPDQTKADEDRLVILLPEAVEAFKAIPVTDERVFHYKIEGFKTNFRRVLERAKLEDIHMHDTRRSFISRVLKTITSSSVVIADMIGARSVSNLEKRTIDRVRQNDMIEAGGIRTEQELRWTVHHKDGQTTSRYTNMAPEKE